MLVTFKAKSSGDVTQFGSVALTLLKMMGRNSKVPGALYAEDVPAALSALQSAINELPDEPPTPDDESDEPAVSMKNRALPLIQLLSSAVEAECGVSWQ
jgi:hypothetical protein